jgi:hypothetical protein
MTSKKSYMNTRSLVLVSFMIFLMIACEKSTNSSESASTGKGGSLARFATVGNYLYLVDYATIEIYDISTSIAFKRKSVFVGFAIETIFPYKDKLFIGSRDGMFIFSIADPKTPVKLGTARHLRSCDPVVADDNLSYVTLRGGPCGPAVDGLYIYDVKEVMNPKQLSLLELSNPSGLGVKDSVVFVCRGQYGLTAVNAKDPFHPKEMYTINDANFTDVIQYENLLICYVSDGLLLYDISNLKSIVKMGNVSYQ